MPTRGWWLLVGSLIGVAATAGAVIPEVEQQTTPSGYAARLADPVHREAALEELVRRKNRGVLTEVARGDGDVAARGWAVVGLARVGGEGVDDTLQALHQPGQPMLVRTWAAAARVGRAERLDDLRELAVLQGQLPALDRPLRLRVEALMGSASVEALLGLSQAPALARVVAPIIVERATGAELVRLMVRHPDDAVRRQAAAFAATKGSGEGRQEVADSVTRELGLPRAGSPIPWEGGALYVPGIAWGERDGRRLVRTLMAWWLRLEADGRRDELRPVWNNLYSYQLLTGSGYDMSLQADPRQLVAALVRVEGRGNARELLSRIGLGGDARFREVVR